MTNRLSPEIKHLASVSFNLSKNFKQMRLYNFFQKINSNGIEKLFLQL